MLAGNASKPKALHACQEAQAKAREEEEWLRDAVEQLDKLAAETDEEDRLAEERTAMPMPAHCRSPATCSCGACK